MLQNPLEEATTHLTVSPVEFIQRLLRSSCHRQLWGFVFGPVSAADGSTRAGGDLRERSFSPPQLRASAYWRCR